MLWRPLVVLSVGLLVLLVAGCAGRGGVSIAISPSEVTLAPGATQEFTAEVKGAGDRSVTWSASGGDLDPSGATAVFTAPAEEGEYEVTAASVSDRGRWATATVLVGPVDDAQTVTLEPEINTSIDVGDSEDRVTFFAGSVGESSEVTLVALSASEVPVPPAGLGVVSVERGFSVEGVDSTIRPAEIRFSLPAGLSDPQVLHKHGDAWSVMPSYVEDGEVVTETSTFSTFVLASALLPTGTYLYEAPGFRPEVHGVQARNVGSVFENAGVVKDRDAFLGFCFGMAETAALYYLVDRPTPVAREGVDATGTLLPGEIHSTVFAEFIKQRQHLQVVGGYVLEELVRMANVLPNDFGALSRAEDIFVKMSLGTPVLMIVSNLVFVGDEAFNHAVLVYKAYKRYDSELDQLEYEFWVYDPNGYQGYRDGRQSHYDARVTITVSNFRAGTLAPWLREVDVDNGLWDAQEGFKVFTSGFVNVVRGELPWTNPTTPAVTATVNDDSVDVSATFDSLSPGASFEEAAVFISNGSGTNEDYTGFVPVADDSVFASFGGLPAGQYIADVVVKDGQGNWSPKGTSSFEIGSDAEQNTLPSIGDFIANPSSVLVGETVTFSWSVSDLDGDPISCTLDVDGDGTGDYTISDCVATSQLDHVYSEVSEYAAVLTVSDGYGTSPAATTAQPIRVREYLLNSVAAGVGHSLAVLQDGRVMAWGNNSSGQLGLGITEGPEECVNNNYASPCSKSPVEVPGLADIVSVAAGWDHSLALDSRGNVWAWGWNRHGQLGIGSLDPIEVASPTRVTHLSDVVAIGAGSYTSLAITKDGTVWGWGWNEWGELGIDPTPYGYEDIFIAVPQEIPGTRDVIGVTGGDFHTMLLRVDGTVWTLGFYLALGHGAEESSHVPTQVAGLSNVVSIAVPTGSYTSYAASGDGDAWWWGQDICWDTESGEDVLAPLGVHHEIGFSYLTANYMLGNCVGVGLSGRAYTWGWDYSGGRESATLLQDPSAIEQVGQVYEVRAGMYQYLLVTTDGDLYSWGDNWGGLLGNGTNIDDFEPGKVELPPLRVSGD